MKEETGLDVAPEALTGIYKNMARGIVTLTFRCRIVGGNLTTNPEADAFRWATQGEVAELTNKVFTHRVLDAYRDDPAPALREHDGVTLILPKIDDPPRPRGAVDLGSTEAASGWLEHEQPAFDPSSQATRPHPATAVRSSGMGSAGTKPG